MTFFLQSRVSDDAEEKRKKSVEETNLFENSTGIGLEILVVDQVKDERQKELVGNEVDVNPSCNHPQSKHIPLISIDSFVEKRKKEEKKRKRVFSRTHVFLDVEKRELA